MWRTLVLSGGAPATGSGWKWWSNAGVSVEHAPEGGVGTVGRRGVHLPLRRPPRVHYRRQGGAGLGPLPPGHQGWAGRPQQPRGQKPLLSRHGNLTCQIAPGRECSQRHVSARARTSRKRRVFL